MNCQVARNISAILLAGFLGSCLCASLTVAQSTQEKGNPPAIHVSASSATENYSRYRPAQLSLRAIEHYQTVWGVDSFVVRTVESGEMIRFSYRVLEAQKAAALNDKKATPYLMDVSANVKLVVPTMEKVGQLRQSSAPEAGKSYWMVFSNKGGFVKRGDRVSVEIGKFSVNGLTVE